MSDKAYSSARTSKLSFKGSKPKKMAPKPTTVMQQGPPMSGAADDDEEEEEHVIQVLGGSGRITSSGTTIFGHDTRFTTELTVGDAVIVSHPLTLVDETKIVRMVLSNMSISISSAFSSDLISTTAFRYVTAPKTKGQREADLQSSADDNERMKKLKLDAEEAAFGTYASSGGTKLVYREKIAGAAGTYRIVEKTLKNAVSRESLLQMRSKKKSDRHCG
jgi:hypothetical protein